jgi:hypothetical protein
MSKKGYKNRLKKPSHSAKEAIQQKKPFSKRSHSATKAKIGYREVIVHFY